MAVVHLNRIALRNVSNDIFFLCLFNRILDDIFRCKAVNRSV
jgi:hypothetical protein